MDYEFDLRVEDENPESEEFTSDFEYIYETIEDSIEIERQDEDYIHEEIFIKITAIKELKKFITNLPQYELPTPECDDKEDGIWFYPRFTVLEMSENDAKVELEYVASFVNLEEYIVWGEFK